VLGLDGVVLDRKVEIRAAGIDAHGFFGSCAPCHAATIHTVEPLIR